MDNKRIIKCFIASPGDTAEERNICEKVFDEINSGIGVPYEFMLQSLRWEADVHPGIGDDGQAVINQQIDGEYDLFIGIMYTKFGTPTKRAGSGTEEEFNNAYERALKLKNMEIMFYFNDSPINPSKIDLTQYQKVVAFRNNVVAQKCMYSMYNGLQDFEDKLRKHLNLYFNKHFRNPDKESAERFTRTSFILEERLNNALQLFSGQPRIWIDPIISSQKEISENPDDNYDSRIDINDIIENPSSIIISAAPQFGLTCLSHHLVLEAWKRKKVWIYIDSNKLKAQDVKAYISKEFSLLEYSPQTQIDCIVVDEWRPTENGALKKLKAVCDTYPEIPVLLMRTLEDSKFIKGKQDDIKINRDFKPLFILTMTRNQIRKVVTKYNQEVKIADTDALLNKVITDLNVLNIHRTPQNCLTLLKVDEKKFDNNPVNRSQMLEDVLYVLFEFTELPRYNSTPDVKDCQFILGCFCEMLIKENRFHFTKEEFLKYTSEYSAKNLIDLDVNIVFNILYENNIISDLDNRYTFKSAFWLLYFVARRMHTSGEFAEYIFKSKKYLDYPEIIEFYTGIDRNRIDALNVLLSDIKSTCDLVFTRISIPDTINPYKLARWNPSLEHIEKMQQEIGESVMSSGLPESIKDKYQDQGYDLYAPFNQNVIMHEFFEEYYVYNLMQEIKSSSRALRNSDYADAEIKKQLLNEILRGWLQISKVLFALIPILASKGKAQYGGAGFLVSDNFGETVEIRARNILFVILTNVVGFFKDDIFSSKIAPLLFDAFEHQSNHLIKQQIALLLIFCRPKKWYSYIEKYIISLSKDSFFLYEILNTMRAQYMFGFIEESDLRNLNILIRKSLAKHELGVNNPSPGQIRKILGEYKPKREIDSNEDTSETNS